MGPLSDIRPGLDRLSKACLARSSWRGARSSVRFGRSEGNCRPPVRCGRVLRLPSAPCGRSVGRQRVVGLIASKSLERAKGFEPSTPTLARFISQNAFGVAVAVGLEPALSERNRFSYHFGFRRRQSRRSWPGLSLRHGLLGRLFRPSSLYTFPLLRAWLGDWPGARAR